MSKLWAYALLCGTLAGCSVLRGDSTGDQRQLALACEVTRCECLRAKASWWSSDDKTEKVAWRPDGSAYCPEGYYLSRVAP